MFHCLVFSFSDEYKIMKKLSLMIAAVAICVVSVAGCGGSDNSTSKPDVNLGEAKDCLLYTSDAADE